MPKGIKKRQGDRANGKRIGGKRGGGARGGGTSDATGKRIGRKRGEGAHERGTSDSRSEHTVMTAAKLSNLDLRIHEVICKKTTKEIDQDEIVLVAIQTLGKIEEKHGEKRVVGKSQEGKTIEVGKFKKDTRKTYKKSKLAARFPLGDKGGEWPRYFYATLLLIEKDEGAIGTIVNQAIDAVDEQLVKAVTSAVSSAAGTAIGSAMASAGATGAAAGSVVPLVGTAIGAAVGAAVAASLAVIKKSRADDCFPPEKIELKLDKYPANKGEVKKAVATFHAFNADYRVVYSWDVS